MENVLKVVKPPQKPTVKASFKAGLKSVFSINKIYKKPKFSYENKNFTDESRNITDRFHFLSASLPKIKNKS